MREVFGVKNIDMAAGRVSVDVLRLIYDLLAFVPIIFERGQLFVMLSFFNVLLAHILSHRL